MSKKLKALVNTVAKKEPVDSQNLEETKKKNIKAGWTCPVTECENVADNHVKANLGFDGGTWFFYKPHVQIYGTDPFSPDITLAEKIVICCEEKDFPLRRGAGEINIIGIEGMNIDGSFNNDQNDQWNDIVGILSFQGGEPRFDLPSVATTEPGRYYTVNPLNPQGAARLDTGYHRQLWQVGQHRGYQALTQNGNQARLVRDRNQNYLRDDKVSYERWKGINFHTTKTTGWQGSASSGSIGRWSAGCVVIKEPQKFLQLMEIVKDSTQYKVTRDFSFDFILLWSRWLEERPSSIDPVPSITDQEIDTLARTLWGEARGESDLGKIAVAWVIRNRASRAPAYGWLSTISEVCKQPFQFSCWNSNDPNREKLLAVTTSNAQFRMCQKIAKEVLEGKSPDPTNGADHYFANYIETPNWAKDEYQVAEIGVHQFYRLVQ